MTDATYTVSLTLVITRDKPLTPMEAVRCFQDEAEQRDCFFYRVTMPDGVTCLVDMSREAVHKD